VYHTICNTQPLQSSSKREYIAGAVSDYAYHFLKGEESIQELIVLAGNVLPLLILAIHTSVPPSGGSTSNSLSDGKTILFTSRFTAIFMALAKALNIASIL
jgi:hypothetical protein